MNGTIQSDGTVVITFNIQHERLSAGNGKQWLPCDRCGFVDQVGSRVVSFYCAPCASQLDLFGQDETLATPQGAYDHACGYRD